jgi:phosphoribosyl-ATP pyrophosphohydrolase
MTLNVLSEFGREGTPMSSDILIRIYEVIQDRIQNRRADSYVSRLLEGDANKAYKKIGEEAVEFVMATANGTEKDIVDEATDLWFHTLVLMGKRGVSPERIFEELEKRFGISGLETKQ